MINTHHAKRKAEAIIKRYKADKPAVNVFDIAAAENFKITYFYPQQETDDVMSLLDLEGGRIFMDATIPAIQQPFILAHQLGHYFLGHDAQHYGILKKDTPVLSDPISPDRPQAELEANIFAIAFLMPEGLVKKAKIKYHLDDHDTTIMQQLFGVPLAVAAARSSI